ncbi:hypothetical protein WJX72_010581 [[Myrmecia] bisecta]|uniref:Phytanoyl-CoA dioxygenase n=1 Tax=[Myrmecia] bisecta TaxID=41462 RepID=A0AAW1PDP0_9CHLO
MVQASCASDQHGAVQACKGVADLAKATSKLSVESDDRLKQDILQAALSLQQHGWAKIEGVLPVEFCQQYVSSVWDWLESLGTGISRNDPATWDQTRWPPSFRGIVNTLEVSHQDFVWQVRKHPRVVQVFAELWGTNELLTSFDSINICKPGAIDDAAPSWLHTDQSPTRRGIVCVQGLLNMVDVSAETTGTLVVKDGSHRAHEGFFSNNTVLTPEEKAATPDFYQFKEAELPFWEHFQSLALSAGAGSLFLWDSRTVHQNCLSPKDSNQWRHVVYCCYQDRSLATPRDLELKRLAWDEYRVTTHWPAMNIKLFPTLGEDYYKKVHRESPKAGEEPHYQIRRTRFNVEDPTLLRLAGAKPYPRTEVWRRQPLLHMEQEDLQQLITVGMNQSA